MIQQLMKNIFIIVLISCASLFGQNDSNPEYHLSSDIGIGYSRFITTLGFQDLKKDGLNGSIRILWHPEHLLSIGLETGYQDLYSIKTKYNSTEFGSSTLKASMNSIPILAIFSMRLFPNFSLHAGTGIFLLLNDGSLYGSSIQSFQTSIGFGLGATYLFPIGKDFSLGIDAKLHHYAKMEDSAAFVQILMSYKFLSW